MPMTFLDYLTENVEDTFVFCFGRYNPPTRGHIAHFKAIKAYAQDHGMKYAVFASSTFEPKKNPIPPDVKVDFIKKAMPDLEVLVAPVANMFKLIDYFAEAGICKRLVYFAGADYFDEGSPDAGMFKRLVSYAEEKGMTLVAQSSGDRTPGVSGSDLRAAMAAGDFDTFIKVAPVGEGSFTIDDARELFEIGRANLAPTTPKKPAKSIK